MYTFNSVISIGSDKRHELTMNSGPLDLRSGHDFRSLQISVLTKRPRFRLKRRLGSVANLMAFSSELKKKFGLYL